MITLVEDWKKTPDNCAGYCPEPEKFGKFLRSQEKLINEKIEREYVPKAQHNRLMQAQAEAHVKTIRERIPLRERGSRLTAECDCRDHLPKGMPE